METFDIKLHELIGIIQDWMVISRRPTALAAYIVALLIRIRLGDIVIGNRPGYELDTKGALGLLMKITFSAFNQLPEVVENMLGSSFFDRQIKKNLHFMKSEIQHLSRSVFRDSNALLLGGGDDLWKEFLEVTSEYNTGTEQAV